MPIPGKRRSRSKKRRGWAHRALSKLTLTRCSNCQKSIPPHRACPFCGSYRGRTVVAIRAKSTAPRRSKAKEKEDDGHRHEG